MLPSAVLDVIGGFVTCELTTIDSSGRPITWPVTPFYRPGDPHISVTTGLGYPKKARDAARNPKVALLFSNPTGSDVARPSMVLVQGIAEVDDHDLDVNRARYARDMAQKLGRDRGRGQAPGESGGFDWYYTRIYVHIRPERIYVWRGGDCELEPELVAGEPSERSEHGGGPDGRRAVWDSRLSELGRRYDSAVLSVVAPDGFPFSIRVPVGVDRRARLIHIDADPGGAPMRPGFACLTAHDHDEKLLWMRNFQVRGDLVERPSGGWAVVPHRVVDGFELPPSAALFRAILNVGKIRRFRKTAKEERAKRAQR
jgi:hypothetical protein